jgi:hypothetical protein
VLEACDPEALCRDLDDEAREPLVTRRIRVRDREDRHETRDAAVADEPLRPADDVVVAVPDRAGPHGRSVRAGLGLGQAEADERLARGEVGHPAGELLGRPAKPERQRAEVLDGEDEAARDTGARDLLDGQADRQEVAADAAVLGRERQAQDVLPCEQAPDVLGELAAAVDLGGPGRDALGGEVANGVTEEDLVLGQPMGAG